jgi:hypothetical protein
MAMKRMLIVVEPNVQNVKTWRLAKLTVTASVMFARITDVFVSIELWYSKISNSLTAAAISCEDNLRNQDETDVDCGGIDCPKCNNTMTCKKNSDCISCLCKNNTCARKGLIFVNFSYCHFSHFSPWNM